MDMEWSESKRGKGEEKDYSPRREQQEVLDDLEENGVEKSRESGRHRSKDKKKTRKEEKDHRSNKDRERSKGADGMKEREKDSQDLDADRVSSRERRREDRDEHEKDRTKDKVRDKDYERNKHRDKGREKDKDRKDHGKERDRGREKEAEKDVDRGRDKERGKEKSKDRDKEKEKENYRERDRAKDFEREYEKEKHKDREEREYGKDKKRISLEVGKEKVRDKDRPEREKDQDKERPRDRDKVTKKNRDEGHDRSKDGKTSLEGEGKDADKPMKGYHHDEGKMSTFVNEQKPEVAGGAVHLSTTKFEERISKMKEERLKNKSSGGSEVLAWVNKTRKLEEEKNAEKEKALRLSRVFEEQDNLGQEESEDEVEDKHTAVDLAGIKVLHGLDKVVEGGAVVLTLKDQNILAGDGINEEIDMLENVEIGEQKLRDEAYIAAKKKTGIYEDKFNEEPGSEKKILPQYDDPVADEGLTLDERGRFSGEAEKKLEELRIRIHGVSAKNQYEDLNSSGKISSDYYTQEEMLRFKKPKKKKSLRKKEKLDINALEAEAVAAGLGVGDLGSRNDGKRQAIREEQERSEAEMRSNAYQLAYAKADEASKALRLDQTLNVQLEEDENPVFGNDDEDLYNSLERARKLALKKQDEEAVSGPKALALLASTTNNQNNDGQNPTLGETQENKVVFTEMEEFVWGLQLDQETQKPDSEDVFMEEDEAPKISDQEREDEEGGWKEVDDTGKDEDPINEHKEIVPDATIHEAAVGKGLSGALSLLKERGSLKESVEWGGRNMDKKKSKLAGLHDNEGTKEIRLERTDEFGRVMTPKEAFRRLSHKFHGKDPGKMKQEKRQKQFMEDLKLKQMKNSDTPSLSVERMREAQSRLKTPYLVLSGQVKPGQTSDPKSGFATVEKDLPGGLTPMLGDRKVEHFLGIKRKALPGTMAPPKKPKT